MKRWRCILIIPVLLCSLAACNSPAEETGGDTQPPQVAITTPANNATLARTFSVSGTASDNQSVATLTVDVVSASGSTTNQKQLSLSNGQFTAEFTVSSVGNYTIQATAVDGAGNRGSSQKISITVDDSIPRVAIALPVANDGIWYTNNASLTVSGTATVTGSATIQSVKLIVENGSTQTNTATGGANWSWSGSITTGTNQLSVYATSSEGKTSQQARITVLLDQGAPSLVISAPTNDQEVGTSYTVEGTASDSVSPIARVYVASDNGAFSQASWFSGAWSHTVSGLVLGPHTNYVYAVDRAGNHSSTNQVRVERAAIPAVTISSPSNNFVTLSNTVNVVGSASIDSPRSIVEVEISLNGGAYSPVNGTENWSTNSFVLQPGENSILVRARSDQSKFGFSQTISVNYITASGRSGMGAIPYSDSGGGVTFRVWAPNGSQVYVAGEFNSWNYGKNPLASEGNGYWSVDVAGASAGQQYKFVIMYEGSPIWRNDPYAREVTSSVGNSVIKDRNYSFDSFSMPSWGELIIYEMHVKTWTENAAVAGSPFAKVAALSGFLKDDLAVNAVELLPVAEFPGDYSWGYNPAHLFAPESHYGGYDAYKDMVNTLHGNGIAVIQDIVHNHYGPSDLDLWCFDGPDYGNGGIYFYTDFKKNTPWGDTRPDYGRGEVRSFIKDNSIYWMEEMGADGLRWDATVYIRKTAFDGSDIGDGWTLLQWCNNEKNSKFSWKISIAEDLQNNASITAGTGGGGAGFDSQWHADFLHKMREQVKKSEDSWRDMWEVKSIIEWIDNGDATDLVKYVESHDECSGKNGKQRLIEDIWPGNARSWYSKKRAGLAYLAAVFSPGIPMLFQGQENLEYGNWDDSVNYSWSDATNFLGYVHMFRDAHRLKRNWDDKSRGLRGNNINVFHVNNNDKVIAFHRWQESNEYGGEWRDHVIVVLNFSGNEWSSYNIGAPTGGTWYCRFNSDSTNYQSDFANYGGYNTTANSGGKDGYGYNMNIGLGKYSAQVYTQIQ